ncbi:MAG: GAF domain-containing protein [Anaerolineales bacterium]|nr:GAF domain-containing protein [Chloroflexota bacterium]MBL6982688.1 GAF domain-containing protein [Anaerolineales bacterium]
MFTWLRKIKIPLWAILIVPFVIQVVVIVGLVGFMSFQNGRNAVNDVAHRLRSEISNRIEDHLRTFLDTPHHITQMNSNTIRQGLLDLNDAVGMERYFWEQIQLFDSVSSTYFGNYAGGLVDAGREGADGSLYVITTDDFVSGPFRKYATDNHGNRTDLLVTVPEFDARTRQWYTAAAEKGTATWSPVYILFTEQDMAISASRPVYDDGENLLGVFSVDIFLSQISDFLHYVDVGSYGESFIVERTGYLIATSTDEEPINTGEEGSEENLRLLATESQTPIIRAAAESLEKHFDGYDSITAEQDFEFEIDGQRHFLQVLPYQDAYGIDWLIVVVFPEAEFLATINANNRITIVLIVAALVFSIIVGAVTARLVAKPILRVKESALALANGERPQPVQFDRIDETSELAQSFNDMAHQLRQTVTILEAEIHTRKKFERKLQQRSRFLELLADLTNAALGSPDIESMIQILAKHMGELVDAEGCYIALWDETTQTPMPAGAYGGFGEKYSNIKAEPGEITMTGSVMQAGKTLMAEDVFNSPHISPRIADMFPTRSILGLPLISGERKLGAALIAFNRPHQFTSGEIARGELAAKQIALAIEKAQLYGKTQKHADELENRVEERTDKLKILVKSMAGREVRMAELKKVIKRLRKQLEDAGMTPVANDPLLMDNSYNEEQ